MALVCKILAVSVSACDHLRLILLTLSAAVWQHEADSKQALQTVHEAATKIQQQLDEQRNIEQQSIGDCEALIAELRSENRELKESVLGTQNRLDASEAQNVQLQK